MSTPLICLRDILPIFWYAALLVVNGKPQSSGILVANRRKFYLNLVFVAQIGNFVL